MATAETAPAFEDSQRSTRSRRVRFKHPVRVTTIDGEPRAWRTLAANLSRDGVFVRMPQPLEPGTRVAISLEANGQALPLAQGEVRWTRKNESGYEGRFQGCGVRFTDYLHPRASELVNYLVETLDTGKPLKAAPAAKRRWWPYVVGVGAIAAAAALVIMVFQPPEPTALPTPVAGAGALEVLSVAPRVNEELAAMVSPAEEEAAADGVAEMQAAPNPGAGPDAPAVGSNSAAASVVAPPIAAAATADAVTEAVPTAAELIAAAPTAAAPTAGAPTAAAPTAAAPTAGAPTAAAPTAAAPIAAAPTAVAPTTAAAPTAAAPTAAAPIAAAPTAAAPTAAAPTAAAPTAAAPTAAAPTAAAPTAAAPTAAAPTAAAPTVAVRPRKSSAAPNTEGQLRLPSGAAASVSWSPSPEGLDVRPQLRGEARVSRVFALSDPPRLVFDIEGGAPSHSHTLATDSLLITRVRLGKQGTRTRVVVDLASEPHRVMPATDHAVLQF